MKFSSSIVLIAVALAPTVANAQFFTSSSGRSICEIAFFASWLPSCKNKDPDVPPAGPPPIVGYYTKAFARFSKVFFPEDLEYYLPLRHSDYPIDDALGYYLKTESEAHSPMEEKDLNVNIYNYINLLGGYPTFPNVPVSHGAYETKSDSDLTNGFWEELREVVKIQVKRRNNEDPGQLLPLPVIWEDFDIGEVAEAVHDEYPGKWHSIYLEKLWVDEVLQIDYDILPFHSNVDFVGLEIRFAELLTWALGVVGRTNFLMKWTVGRPRPEECAYQIARDLLTTEEHGVPADLVVLIKSLNLKRPEDFTAYDEGCPNHPSWPAMHSAGSAMSLWLATVAELTDEQYCQVRRVDYAVSFARTVAGVHYTSDNRAGLNLGQQLLAEVLPSHLAERYGADKTAVAKKVASLRFDWEKFDPVTCKLV